MKHSIYICFMLIKSKKEVAKELRNSEIKIEYKSAIDSGSGSWAVCDHLAEKNGISIGTIYRILGLKRNGNVKKSK